MNGTYSSPIWFGHIISAGTITPKRILSFSSLFSTWFFRKIYTKHSYQSYTNKINHIRKYLPPEEQIRHKNFVPAIIDKDVFDKVHYLLDNKRHHNVSANAGKPYHRYTGLLKCADCGSTFTCKTRKSKNRPPYQEYVCNKYDWYGKEHCSSHRIAETVLDQIIYDELLVIRDHTLESFKQIDIKLTMWQKNKILTQNNLEQLKRN